MPIVKCSIKGMGSLYYGKRFQTEKGDDERDDVFEEKHWMERAHYDSNGGCFIPANAFKFMMMSAAARMKMSIPGDKRATFSKIMESGISVIKDCPIGVNAEDLYKHTLFVPSDGRRGGTRRVPKHFPVAKEWTAEPEFLIIHPFLTEEIFIKHLRYAGIFIGLMTYRPERGHDNGRFTVESWKWRSYEVIDGLTEFMKAKKVESVSVATKKDKKEEKQTG